MKMAIMSRCIIAGFALGALGQDGVVEVMGDPRVLPVRV